MSLVTIEILQRWISGNKPTADEWLQLLAEELTNSRRAEAFELTEKNGLDKIEAQTHLFLDVYSEVIKLCEKLGFKEPKNTLLILWQLWLPLAIQLGSEREKLGRTLIQGILGGQGTGKTTLGEVSCLILSYLGYSTLGISLDDLYKTYEERQKMQQIDPRLIWRGPPGTHDVQLGGEILDQLRKNNSQDSILVPRFDKSIWNGAGDRTKLERVEKADIVLFEGWFIGVHPLNESAFDNPPSPIVTSEDKLFAKDINERLKEYLPLWERLDRLMILYPIDYHLSKQWRTEAEQKMIASGKSGMSDEEINQFVEYFWRSLHPELFITPLTKNPLLVDMVIEINADHSPGAVYRPS
ncbi:MAG: glycerate kinase [Moorea sp. SIO2B7]|nr:glycerate kinase [Moorena sp. SIO2B7]